MSTSIPILTWAIRDQNRPRHRRKHSKTFSGCKNCKTRHVKCDEQKPSCLRCLRSKLACHYEPAKIWLFNPESSGMAVRSDVVRSPNNVTSSEYQRSLQFYRERAAPVFASYFGAPFWTESVLRIGQDDPILQFGIMTASSCIENLSSPSRQAQAEFYHNYNVAIRKVSEAPSPPPLESTMAIIGLLTCCELRNGSINSGLTHLRAGFNIAREYLDREGEEGKSDNPTHRFLTEQCLPLLAGFAFQAQLYGCQLLSDGQLSDYSDEGYVLPQIPDSFASIQQAHHCLGGILHHLALFGSAVGCAWDWQLIRKLGKLLASWSSALDTYEHRIGASQWEADRPSLGMLRCNFDMALNLMLGLSLEINSKAKSPQRWQSLLQGVPGHVKALKIEDALRDGLIHSEVECIPSLFIVILGTVSGNASDDALRILEGWDRREGNWTAAIAARTARLIIDQAQDDIPGPEHAEWEQLPVCLHHASFQFPISRVLHWLHRPPFAESVLARCLCRQGQMVPRHNSLNTRTVQQVPCGVPG